MPEQYEWEWLRQPANCLTEEASWDDRQIRSLRRWITTDPQSDGQAAVEPGRDRRQARRQERKQQRQQVEKPMPKPKDDYRESLKQEFKTLFGTLELQERQRHYLRSRWLDQVLWMEGRSGRARDLHFRLRLTTIIGGVVIPALVSLNFTGNNNPYIKQTVSISTFVLSQIVAVSAATEQFFNHGEKWRHYRRSVESLKTQGWQFFELSGPYQPYKTHVEAFNVFAAQVEGILQHDVEVYATQVTQAKKEEESKEGQESFSVKGTNGNSTVANLNVNLNPNSNTNPNPNPNLNPSVNSNLNPNPGLGAVANTGTAASTNNGVTGIRPSESSRTT